MQTELPLFPAAVPDDSESLAEGAVVLRGFASVRAPRILGELDNVLAAAPFRHMETPGGFRMSVAMSNCGARGWVTDRTGYRYTRFDPDSGQAWPAMPPVFLELARAAADRAGHSGFAPDACLVNRYAVGAKLSLHQDKDERDHGAPIVSVSLGLPAVFLFGGPRRKDRQVRVPLFHGDVVVWGGPARLYYHGILPVAAGCHPATGAFRINLTFRKAG